MNSKSIDYVIIQAGGLGSRMEEYTKNKPKCLIPYRGRTILERLFNTFNNKKIILICDYLEDVIKNYTKYVLNKEDIIFIKAEQKTTTSGIKDALEFIPDGKPFLLVWSDIIFESFKEFDFNGDALIFTTDSFECRYKFYDNKIIKGNTKKDGILGLYAFSSKEVLKDIDESKSFVGDNLPKLKNLSLKKIDKVLEIGTKDKYIEILKSNSTSRFFNSIKISNDSVEKICIDKDYENLIKDEIAWYKLLNNKVSFIPTLLNENPLIISKIEGEHIFSMNLERNDKVVILDSIINNLKIIHSLGAKPSNIEDLKDIYYHKTFNRVKSIEKIIPHYNNPEININKKYCKNPFHEKYIKSFQDDISKLYSNEYHIIHGDCTFSNIIVNNKEAYFIDPRGSFGKSKIYGDRNYDWAKLYYSINGNYDSINSKKFQVNIDNKNIALEIKSNGFEDFSDYLIDKTGISKEIMILQHALIWLSLTGYVKEDIDAVIYSFYKGIYEWNLIQS